MQRYSLFFISKYLFVNFFGINLHEQKQPTMKVRIKIANYTDVMFHFEGQGSVFYRLDHLYRFAESLGYIFDEQNGLKAYFASTGIKMFFCPVTHSRKDWLIKAITHQLVLPIAIGNYFDSDSQIEIISYENTLEEKGQN